MRYMVGCIGLLVMAVAACALAPPTPSNEQVPPARSQEYTVLMGPDDYGTQLNAYFPGAVTARPGDALVFENRSIAPHTITFGVGPDPLDWPPQITPDGQPNPAALGPCATDQAPTLATTSCLGEEAVPLPAFTGQGLWTSGVLPPSGPDVPVEVRSAQLELSEDIRPGRYRYVCIIHPSMAGTVEVVDGDAAAPSPAEVAQAGRDAHAQALSAVAHLDAPDPEAGGGGPTIATVGETRSRRSTSSSPPPSPCPRGRP
ncbi:MAG: cupredoxin domain-containing protein [Egibacteraceae bacterium]